MAEASTPKPNTIFIDGTEYPFKPGQTVIQVAHENGYDVPHYCYHPGLSIAGNCRICMVEVEGQDRPQISCKMGCWPGLRVRTDSDLAKDARRGVMEMLLVNHPLDCPICDQAGECHLQDYSYEHGEGESRASTPKTHLPKNVPFGEGIVYDAERCIKCTLCVRFCEEITDTHELAMANRSDHEMVVMTSEGEFKSGYSMNIVDICPVGALTSRDFRFKSRLWFMEFVPTVCTSCARGCSVTVGVRGGDILRNEPRENQDINKWWMCDAGRLDYRHANSETRLSSAAIRNKDGSWRAAGYEEAIVEAAKVLRDAGKGGNVLLDGGCTLEEMFMGRALANVLGGSATFAAPMGDDADDFLVVNDKAANAEGARALGIARQEAASPAAVIVVERDRNVGEAMRNESGALVAFVTDAMHVPDSVQVAFPFGSYVERSGHIANCDGIVQSMASTSNVGPGSLLAAHELMREIASELDDSFDVIDVAKAVREDAGAKKLTWPAVTDSSESTPALAGGPA